jgi:hypothetical protein
VSVKQFCRFLIKREKNTKAKNNNKNIPSSKAIHFQVVLQHPVLLSHHIKMKKKKGVWRHLCECLSDSAANLLPTVSHLLLQALFI